MVTGSDYETLGTLLKNDEVARRLITSIHEDASHLGPVRLMEVCGTHTVAIRRSGIPSLLPGNLALLSGPGCPVCVTPNGIVDHAIALAGREDVILVTFGDMIRVPGSTSSLARARSLGADIRVVYSPLDALKIARGHEDKQVVFLGVGFETTAPTVAAAVQAADQVGNFSVLVAHKLVPPALDALCTHPDFAVDGLICPGHVSTIIGSEAYQAVARQYGVPCVIAGFEPVDVLLAVSMLLRQIRDRRHEVEVEYRCAVKPEGNQRALQLMNSVFVPTDSDWRGLGTIADSGLTLRQEFEERDAARRLEVEVEPLREHPGCQCGQVLVGSVQPAQCPMFGKGCTPSEPLGPCMVSSEGTCAAHFRFGS
jgi:hydrogenase expression/formation protein HypD